MDKPEVIVLDECGNANMLTPRNPIVEQLNAPLPPMWVSMPRKTLPQPERITLQRKVGIVIGDLVRVGRQLRQRHDDLRCTACPNAS